MDAFFKSTALQKETYIFIILGVVLKHRSTNFTLVESSFAWEEQMYILNGTPKAFYVYIYFRIIILEEESTSLSINIFEGLDTIFTKEVSSSTNIPDAYEIEMLK